MKEGAQVITSETTNAIAVANVNHRLFGTPGQSSEEG
jgi:hypothetical protein